MKKKKKTPKKKWMLISSSRRRFMLITINRAMDKSNDFIFFLNFYRFKLNRSLFFKFNSLKKKGCGGESFFSSSISYCRISRRVEHPANKTEHRNLVPLHFPMEFSPLSSLSFSFFFFYYFNPLILYIFSYL